MVLVARRGLPGAFRSSESSRAKTAVNIRFLPSVAVACGGWLLSLYTRVTLRGTSFNTPVAPARNVGAGGRPENGE